LCTAVVNSWCELFPERLETGETYTKVAKIMKIYLHSISTANWMLEGGIDYVKSSRRDLCKVGCNTLDSEDAKERQSCKAEWTFKNLRSLDYLLKFEGMKLELLVIVDHHATVNRKTKVHT
jgi:hypothetical protein